MPSWNELLAEFQDAPNDSARSEWLPQKLAETLKDISRLRGDRHVISYMSAFLQRPDAPPYAVQITHEDLNGFMSAIYGMEWDRNLTIVLHTPGGVTTATETIVEYLRSKFDGIEVIVPTFAMSAGTMISLASDVIVLGRPSQLGPIDPQLGQFSAQAVVDQFEAAKLAILGGKDPAGNDVEGDLDAAHLWAPLLQSMGPALLQSARNALEYSERMVAGWLGRYMLAGDQAKADEVAHYFSDAGQHRDHGRRIDRDDARAHGVPAIEDLEDSQELQEAVLTLYHLQTIAFEHSFTTKAMYTDHKRVWVKNHARPSP